MSPKTEHYLEYALICFCMGYGGAWSIEYIGGGPRMPLPVHPFLFGLLGAALGLVWAYFDKPKPTKS